MWTDILTGENVWKWQMTLSTWKSTMVMSIESDKWDVYQGKYGICRSAEARHIGIRKFIVLLSDSNSDVGWNRALRWNSLDKITDLPDRWDYFEAVPTIEFGAELDGAQSQIFLHDGQRVLRTLAVDQLVVLDHEPSPMQQKNVKKTNLAGSLKITHLRHWMIQNPGLTFAC